MQALCLYRTRGHKAIIGFLSWNGGMPCFQKCIFGSECPLIDASLIDHLRPYYFTAFAANEICRLCTVTKLFFFFF